MATDLQLTTTAHGSAARLRALAQALAPELRRTRGVLAQLVAQRMRVNAPKGVRSLLTNSIRAEEEGADSHLVKPNVAYAAAVEKGRRPGKGLPRFFDPAASGAVAWLEARLAGARRLANPKYRKARTGSKRGQAEELELRDAYMAWSRAVKLRGIKAQPFVRPTAEQMQGPVVQGLVAAVRELAARKLNNGNSGNSGGGAA